MIQYNLRTVGACVAEQLTSRTLVGGLSLARRLVSLDKEVYSTLSLLTQVYKWIPATYYRFVPENLFDDHAFCFVEYLNWIRSRN